MIRMQDEFEYDEYYDGRSCLYWCGSNVWWKTGDPALLDLIDGCKHKNG